MAKMKELYEKVAADSSLQVKFAEITKDAKTAGEEATREKMVGFAKEAGYDITVAEMQEFFNGLTEQKNGALSDAELDQVAGGKDTVSMGLLAVSIVSLGLECAIFSIEAAVMQITCDERTHQFLDATL